MKRITIETDEWYPVFLIDTRPREWEQIYEVSDEFFEEYLAVGNAFDGFQRKLLQMKEERGDDA